MSLQQAIAALRDDPRLADGFLEWRVLPAEPAHAAEWPGAVDERIVEALRRRGVERPYTQQAEAIRNAFAGLDQVIVTPTASGKTLCYTVPVLNAILEEGEARALYLFPTKALAQDQLDELHGLVTEAEVDIRTFTYDGDTPPNARRAVRHAGHVVITNPDMLHTGILPNHTRWVRLFERLRYVVIDELHSYRGVFGSHVANVLRRLQRICRFYGSDPQFICCSATIANPGELAEALIGRHVEVVDQSGAPRGERVVALYNPPLVNRELGIRRGVVNSATDISSTLLAQDVQSILFAGSRTRVEVMTQYLRERPGGRPRHPGQPEPVRGYRSGYLPKERRAIEAALRSGELRTVVATNALELGIDIGGLDASVVAGYPGTLASLWQQLGRAGRRAEGSLAVYVAGSSALDQYVVTHPDYVFGERVEAGLINPDNPLIAAEHLKCAVFELPLVEDEHADLGTRTPALLDALDEVGLVHIAGDRAYWSSEAYPAEEISLRQGPEQNVVIIERGPPPRVIGEVDRPSAMTLVHDEAIYIHDGHQFHVDELDFEELKAYVRPVEVDYYTDAHLAVDLKVLDEWDAEALPSPRAAGAQRGHGEVAVTYLATIFKKIKLHTHENIGWGKIRLPQDDLHTGTFWLTLPPELGSDHVSLPNTVEGGSGDVEGLLQGVGRLLRNVAPLLLMCDPRDLHLSAQVKSPHTGQPTIFLWEAVPGGVGFGAHLYLKAEQLLVMARDVLEVCPCEEGCPGCVGPPGAPGLGVKAACRLALRSLAGDARGVPTLATPASAGSETAQHAEAVAATS